MTHPVREATPADADAVVALWQAAGLTRPWNDPATDYALALTNPAAVILIVEMGDTITGTIMVGYDGHRGWVYYLGVAPEHRRRGIGGALMQAAERWLAARDCPKVMLMVRRDNLPTRAFYQTLGYETQDVVTLGRRLDGR